MNRKSKIIRETNLILEKRYLMREQAPPAPAPAQAPAAATTPAPAQPQTPPSPEKKVTDNDLKSDDIKICANQPKGTFADGKLKSGETENNFYYLTSDGKDIFCKDPKETKS